MISFKEYLLESKNQIQWDGNPKIGWWKEAKVLRLYHGTNIEYLDSISKEGLNRPDPKTGMISFAIEPFTARAFAVMGGEARFLGAGAKAKTVAPSARCTLVFDIPQMWIQKNLDQDLHGNDPEHKERLMDKEIYDSWNNNDQQYYQLCELRVRAHVPPKFMVGYMMK